jgi:hypothetical protein
MGEGESSYFHALVFSFVLQDVGELTCSLFTVVSKCAAKSDIKIHFAQAHKCVRTTDKNEKAKTR